MICDIFSWAEGVATTSSQGPHPLSRGFAMFRWVSFALGTGVAIEAAKPHIIFHVHFACISGGWEGIYFGNNCCFGISAFQNCHETVYLWVLAVLYMET